MKRILKTVFLLVFSLTSAFAQIEVAEHYNYNDSINRINLEIAKTTDPKIKVEKLIELSFYFTDYNEALEKLKEAKNIAEDINETKLITVVDIEMAMIHKLIGNIEESVTLYDASLSNYKNNVDERTYYLTVYQYCKALFDAGRYYETLEQAQKSYDYFSSQKDEYVYQGLISQIVAAVYKKLERKQEAIEQYEIAIDWCSKGNHPNCVTSSWQSIANLNLEIGNIEKANKSIEKATLAIEAEEPLQWQLIFINLIKAKIKLAENNPNGALDILDANLEKVIKQNWKLKLSQYHLLYAKAYIAKGEIQKALKNTTIALNIGNDKKSKVVTKSAHLLNSEIFEKLGNSKKALESFRNYHAINESTLSAEKISQINELDSKYQKAIIQNKLNILEKENALKELEIQKGNQRKMLLYGGATILLILLLMLYYFFRKKSETNQILKEKNQIINKSLQDKDILLREIHHRVKNNLQVVSSLLNLQANYISDDTALEAITEGKNRVSSMALIHQNLYREENLTSINSKEYFDDLIDNLFDSYNIEEENIELSKEIEDLDIDVDTMIPLGLIVNELVSNSLKHAFKDDVQKGNISIRLFEHNGLLTLSIADNGIGMTEDHFLSSDSFGNKMIKAFQQKLKAGIKIENDNGTKVTINIKNYKLNAA